MGEKLLAHVRRMCDDGNYVVQAQVCELLADRDYHYNRAEEAEDENAQLLADLAETTAKLRAAQRELAALRGELIR